MNNKLKEKEIPEQKASEMMKDADLSNATGGELPGKQNWDDLTREEYEELYRQYKKIKS